MRTFYRNNYLANFTPKFKTFRYCYVCDTRFLWHNISSTKDSLKVYPCDKCLKGIKLFPYTEAELKALDTKIKKRISFFCDASYVNFIDSIYDDLK